MPEKRSVWVARAGRKGEAESLFFGENLIALGWSKMGDLSVLPDDRDAFKARMTETCGDTMKPNAVPVRAGLLYRFVYETQIGDLVITPTDRGHQLHIGIIGSGYAYAPDLGRGFPHTRSVRWLKTIPRSAVSAATQNELDAILTFFRVKWQVDDVLAQLGAEFSAEDFRHAERIEASADAAPAPLTKTALYDAPATVFKKVDLSLSGLLHYIDVGDIGLPDIQRPFVWSASKVRDLFDSMYRGFPVGYLLFWSNSDNTAEGTKSIGVGEKPHKVPALLVVDGQQRLTSLYAVFRGKPVLDDEFNETRIEIAFRPADGSFEVTDATTRRNPEFIPSISDLWSAGKGTWEIVNDFLSVLEQKRTISGDDKKIMAKNIDRLVDLQKYPFTTLEIAASVEEEQVADIFVRINSEGVKLNQADFILTLLSVFWDEGRDALERFSRGSRVPPGPGQGASPFNVLLQPDPDQLLRVAVAVGFQRGRLKSVYQLLRGKDLETGHFSPDRRVAQFAKLKSAQADVLDLRNWHQFLNALRGAGFRSRELFSSDNALLYSYALYLLGRTQFGVDDHTLGGRIGRWFFAASLTARYTSSPEAAIENDLARLRNLSTSEAFIDALEGAIATTLTSDFWTITLPGELETSSSRNPALLAFYASQCRFGAPALFSTNRIGDMLDPLQSGVRKGVERHHLFPRAYLESIGVKDLRQINQAANLTYLEWPDNAAIGKSPPKKYVPELRTRFSEAAWDRMSRLHALPNGWEEMEYPEFLRQRRSLMAAIVRRGYDSLLSTSDELAEGLDLVGSADEHAVWHVVEKVELRLRQVVGDAYTAKWGAGAEARIRKTLGDQSWDTIQKNRAKHQAQYPLSGSAPSLDVLAYAYLGQLAQLMLASESWELFRAPFKDKRHLEEMIAAITPVRNDRAHFRQVPAKELQRCQIACDDLLALLSKDGDAE
jgi:hypothetical protein